MINSKSSTMLNDSNASQMPMQHRLLATLHKT